MFLTIFSIIFGIILMCGDSFWAGLVLIVFGTFMPILFKQLFEVYMRPGCKGKFLVLLVMFGAVGLFLVIMAALGM